MDFPEIKHFIEWWMRQEKKGIQMVHYNLGFSGVVITDREVTKLQLTALGVRVISQAEALALEAVCQMLNEINNAESLPPVSRDDVF